MGGGGGVGHLLRLTPGALAKDFIQVEGDGLLLNQTLHLSNLENLAKGDFKANLGKIIHDIYQTAHVMFADMPQGDHKKRAKYRFASKTLMRILPADKKTEVEGLIEKKTITLDLYEILGQCTWGQPQ